MECPRCHYQTNEVLLYEDEKPVAWLCTRWRCGVAFQWINGVLRINPNETRP